MTREALENVIRFNGAIGGSINAATHLIPKVHYAAVSLDLDDWNRLGCDVSARRRAGTVRRIANSDLDIDADGGPLSLVQDGDMIAVDVRARSLHLDVDEDTLAERATSWIKPKLDALNAFAPITSFRPTRGMT